MHKLPGRGSRASTNKKTSPVRNSNSSSGKNVNRGSSGKNNLDRRVTKQPNRTGKTSKK